MDWGEGLLLVGDDWAEEHHDVELQDETGRVLGRAKLPEGVAGIARLHAMIGEHLGEDDDAICRANNVAVGSSDYVACRKNRAARCLEKSQNRNRPL